MRLWMLGLMLALATAPVAADELMLVGRSAIVVAPQQPTGLVIVLHGGGGNGAQIRRGLGEFESGAEAAGLVVAYLDGSSARRGNGRALAWNAGGCCGAPGRQGVDDAGYIAAAVADLQRRYQIAPDHTFALGHSNGGMMAEAMVCSYGVFARIVAVSGPLQDAATCPAANGRAVLAIHGDRDENVPIGGGFGSGIAGVDFKSEAEAEARLVAGGATYRLLVVKGAAHRTRSIDTAMTEQGASLGRTALAFLLGQELP